MARRARGAHARARRRSLEALASRKGPSALEPCNFGYFAFGDVTRELDPYFRFETALERWGRSFMTSASATTARRSRSTSSPRGQIRERLHARAVSGLRDKGKWRSRRASTSRRTRRPGRSAAGLARSKTLFHEGGHAAHFANIFMPAPCFSQEFAPTSVGLRRDAVDVLRQPARRRGLARALREGPARGATCRAPSIERAIASDQRFARVRHPRDAASATSSA